MSEKVRVTAENGRRRRRSGVQDEACCVRNERAAQSRPASDTAALHCNTSHATGSLRSASKDPCPPRQGPQQTLSGTLQCEGRDASSLLAIRLTAGHKQSAAQCRQKHSVAQCRTAQRSAPSMCVMRERSWLKRKQLAPSKLLAWPVACGVMGSNGGREASALRHAETAVSAHRGHVRATVQHGS